jgi:hypothetical protein
LRGPGESYGDVILRLVAARRVRGFGFVCQAGRVSTLLLPHRPQRSR